MRSSSLQAGMLLAFCFISEAWSQSSVLEKSYSTLSSITPAEEFFFFTLNDDEHGLELWRSDGSTSGTFLIKDIRPDQLSSSPSNLKLINNRLFFTADDGVHGRELWCSDGSNEGTYLVADLSVGTQSSVIEVIGRDGNELIFQIYDDTKGLVTWRSDGTFAGTVVVNETEDTYSNHEPSANHVGRNEKKHLKNLRLKISANTDEDDVEVNGRILFVAADARGGEELWCRGERKVSLVKDIHPGRGESFITHLTGIGNQVYFSAYDGLHGSELWMSDGTPDGTEMIMDILPGTASSLPRNFMGFDGKVYFSIVAENGIQLWGTDGTQDGTKEIFPATPSKPVHEATAERTSSLNHLGVNSTISEEGTISQVYVFPNPFTNRFLVRVDSPLNENVALTLMDVTNWTMYDASEKIIADTYLVKIRTRKSFETVRVTKAN